MSFFDNLILDVILILFPMILILILRAHNTNVGKISKDYLIDIANFSATFLLIKYSTFNTTYDVLLVNIPFIISILYMRKVASSLLAIVMIVFYFFHGYNLDVLLIEYMVYLLIFIIMNKKKKSYNYILLTFLFIKGVSLTIENFYLIGNDNAITLCKIFLSLIAFYLIGVLVISIINIFEKTISLNQTLKELEREKNLKNSLFKITHEVKNPIAVCKGYLAMMDYDDIDKVKRYNSIIQDEIDRTLDIMDNFSEYTKIKINTDIMDVDSLIQDTISSMKMYLENCDVKINYNFDDKDEILINGDYNRLKQVIINMLKNSCEAIEGDGKIDITLKKSKRYVIIKLKDNGKGMTEEELEKIGQLFYSSKDKGCGIGVSLSSEIIRLHQGELKYKSVLGEYTEAIIKLPYDSKDNY